MTVNKVLSALAASGLIVRRRRSGSFVAAQVNENSVLQIHAIEDDIRRDGKRYRLELRSRIVRKATKRDAGRLRVPTGTRVFALNCIHFADDRPLVLEDRLINLAAVPSAAAEDFRKISPGRWLLAKVPWSEAEHSISAMNASVPMAAALKIREGEACLVVQRWTGNSGHPVTHVTLSYPGSKHRLLARFNPASHPVRSRASGGRRR